MDTTHRPEEVPVLVVGAGPVGLTMACALRHDGIACRIIEQAEGPTPAQESRALAIHSRTMELLESIGLADVVLREGHTVRAIDAYDHGRPFARLDLDFAGLGTPYPFVMVLPQGETERRLVDRLAGFGGSVEWHTRLTCIQQDEAGVTAKLTAPDGSEREVRSAWLVGCDGAHSTVRHLLDMPFKGVPYEEKFLLADVRLRWKLPQHEAHLLLTPGGVIAAFPLPFPNGWRLVDATGGDHHACDTPEAIVTRFQAVLREAGFEDANIEEAMWSSAFRISRRATDHLRTGRCFLAGDAAHIHSPVGGQGMNTGIQDACNLAWKLALVISGAAPPMLLDSYDAERLPVATAVRKGTHWATWIATLRNPVARSVRNGLAGWLSHLRFVRRQLTRELSELGISYRRSPAVVDDWHAGSPSGVPRAGERVPDLNLAPTPGGPARLFDLFGGTRHTLLLFEGTETTAPVGQGIEGVEERIRDRWGKRIEPYHIARSEVGRLPRSPEVPRLLDADGTIHRRFGARHESLYLIRPDGYVGYRAQPADPSRFDAYLSKVLV